MRASLTISCLLSMVAFLHVAGQSPADLELAKLKADPEYLTPTPDIKLTARSQGGKSRYTPWATDYGSYNRVDTSTRQYVCTVSSISRLPQRVRMQCFIISRNLDTRGVDVTLLADMKVSLPIMTPKTAGAWSEVTNTDDNYVALGSRYKSGDKYLGWSWRAIDGQGRICAVVSSQPAYDRHTKDQPLEPEKVAEQP